MLFYSYILTGQISVEGCVYNTSGQTMPNTLIRICYSRFSLSDRSMPYYISTNTNSNGQFKIKLACCVREKNVKVIAVSKGYESEFYCFIAINKKNKVKITLRNSSNYEPIPNIISNEISVNPDTFPYYLAREGNKIIFTKEKESSNFAKITFNKQPPKHSFVIESLMSNQGFLLLDSLRDSWIYTEPVLNKITNSVELPITPAQNIKGNGFLFSFSENEKYRLYIQYFLRDNGIYNLTINYLPFVIGASKYFYSPEDIKEIDMLFDKKSGIKW